MADLLGDRTLEAAQLRAKREQEKFLETYTSGISMTVVPEVVEALNELDRRLKALEGMTQK